MYLTAKVEDAEIKLLVDTGATVTLLSKRVFDQIKNSSEDITVEESNQEIMTAEGKPLKVYGVANLDITLGLSKYQRKMVVADISVDGILGLDFMNGYNTILNVSEKTLSINGERHSLELEGRLGCYRVVASESFTISPRSEVVAYCEVCVPPGNIFSSGGLGIVEPRDHFLDSNKGLVGRTLVQNNSKVPVRFMNLSADANTIYKGTYVGNLAQASQVFEEGISSRCKQPWSKEFMDLKKETLSKLGSKQQTQVDKFLLKYATVFAGSGDELGRTDVVKHSIKTGDARPIKQPPRRIPFHMREEADKLLEDMLKRGVVEPSSSP